MKVWILMTPSSYECSGSPISVHRSEEGAELKKTDPEIVDQWRRDVDTLEIEEFEVED